MLRDGDGLGLGKFYHFNPSNICNDIDEYTVYMLVQYFVENIVQ